ncbi:hypothetical protein C8A03DRAFT_29149 [Achaetomium macrosporum]|uniref:Uncharacterized protein n=1 Tax=Achaetomium macrosporum TaxID=79813 RepID=A0AAN7HHS3_9PEZI|nr:hypothetical protein C8A03DRAFT_29149 [Achaetomium macrosporum]
MKSHMPSLAAVLGALSLAQAAAYERRQEQATSSQNIASGFLNIINRLGGPQTVTETVRQTITVGGGGAVGAWTNATGIVTVTVTAAASTVTLCPPGQVGGAVDGVPTSGSVSAAPGGAAGSTLPAAHGGVGVSTIPVPADAIKTSAAGSQPATSQPPISQPAVSDPAVSQPAASQPPASSETAATSSSLTPLPSQGETSQSGLVPPPGLSTATSGSTVASEPTATSESTAASEPTATSESTTASEPTATSESAATSVTSLAMSTSVETQSGAAGSTSLPIVGAPISDSSAATSASTLAPLPALASSLSNTLILPGTGNAAPPTPISVPGAFGGSPGMIPISSAAAATSSPTTPAVANAANAGPTIDVSGLTLTSKLTLGNLAPTPAPRF